MKLHSSADPASEPVPSPWNTRLSSFQKLLLLRVLRPDKLTSAIRGYVLSEMGAKFVEPPPFSLAKSLADSTATTPLIYILSPGSDPMSGLLAYADSSAIAVEAISLGQGQGSKAEKLIESAQARVRFELSTATAFYNNFCYGEKRQPIREFTISSCSCFASNQCTCT